MTAYPAPIKPASNYTKPAMRSLWPHFHVTRLLVASLLMVALILPTMAQAIETKAREAVIIEATTGKVLFSKNGDARMPPASMSKLMTIYMVMTRIKEGSLSLEDTFRVSENAWRTGGAKSGSSTMFLEPNKRVSVEQLLRGIIVQSGNDACIVVAEGLAGSEAAFSANMTETGKKIGLTGSNFVNSTGWPHPDQYMTANDLARLALLTITEFPEYYHYYSETEYTYNGIRQRNRNPLLYKGIGVDGLKTGHTVEAGYGLTASALIKDRRIIVVVNGLASKKDRSSESERLMDWAYREFNNYTLVKKGDVISQAEVWLGTAGKVPLVSSQDLTITLARKARKDMKVTVQYEGPIAAPIKAGTPIAQLVITAPDEEPVSIPLLAGADVDTLGLIGRLGEAVDFLIWGQSG